ncbi:YidB family protein [Massilia sp. B-10]|nr:YidB family protein [Massilia sp. B-10]UUZ52534.1 YidB family protein [Massilia sp. H-1]
MLQQLQQSGLGDQVASWIGTGANHAISGEQLSAALGSGQLADVAQQSGVDPSQLSGGLAALLPQVIDQLSPNGQLPEGDMLGQGLNLLKGKLFN